VTDTTVTTSVIIPVYNDPEGIQTTVESLLNQTVDDYEVIIADNGSTDLTRKITKAYASQDRVRRVVEDEIQGSYAARNAGIAVAQGDLLCFVDADMWVDDDWVERVQDRMQRDSVDYLGCDVEVVVVEQETLCAQYTRQTGFPIEQYMREKQFAPTCCLVTRRAVINEVGDFDERLVSAGDAEFGKRVYQAGYDQTFADDITLYHPARESPVALLNRHYRIGRGIAQSSRYHSDLFADQRHPLHPFNFLPVRVSSVPETFRRRSLYVFGLMYLVLSLLKLATTVGQISELLRRSDPSTEG